MNWGGLVTRLFISTVTLWIFRSIAEVVAVGSREVKLTVSKKAPFGGYGIELDSPLATVLGGREGQKISPSEMTKRLWQYIKRHNLGKKD